MRLLARALYEIRVLLAGHVTALSTDVDDVNRAAHLAYALHNDALAVADGNTFDIEQTLGRLRAIDAHMGSDFVQRVGLAKPPE